MKKSLLICLMLGLVSFLATTASADSYVRGILRKVDGNTLVVDDAKGASTNVHLTTNTVSVSREYKRKIDPHKLSSGSKVNITVRNGDAIVLVVEETSK